MKNITILGSTGSIGQSVLDVISRHPGRFKVFALAANTNVEVMLKQCLRHQPQIAVMRDEIAAKKLKTHLQHHASDIDVLTGDVALTEIASASDVDSVVAAIVGAAGLMSTLAAAKAGKRVLLANKEALVMSGALLIEAIQKNQGLLLPIDSEHNALFQCMPEGYRPGTRPSGVTRLLLTASGGAFRDWPLEQLSSATPSQACLHPNWTMGRKITVDSATMLNKALEVIEAYWLFNMPVANIEVVLHPQSIIHSLVEYEDGSTLAQLGEPDMRTPIAQVLAWPERISSGVKRLDLISIGHLDFAKVSPARYPCLQLAYDALKLGGTATAVLNAANEIAVQAFLDGHILFTDIYRIVASVMDAIAPEKIDKIETVLEADKKARVKAVQLIM